jgi:cytidine deaminase
VVFTKLNKALAARPKFVPTPEDTVLLNKALAAAAQSDQRFRVGASSSTAVGYNSRLVHAEESLVSRCATQVECTVGQTVAVARLGKKNDWRCSYPCEHCHELLMKAGARRLVCFDEQGHPVSLVLV